jgi:hypothetical protein
VPIRVRDVLHQVGRPVEHVYFPHSGMGSIVTPLRRGIRIEAATIGNEGILDVAYVLGDALATEELLLSINTRFDRGAVRPRTKQPKVPAVIAKCPTEIPPGAGRILLRCSGPWASIIPVTTTFTGTWPAASAAMPA